MSGEVDASLGPVNPVAAATAVAAYRVADAAADAPPAPVDFGGVLARSLGTVEAEGEAAESAAARAISGEGDIAGVVTAVSKAELALQTTMAVRDRVVQAYQDIMRMAI